MKIALDNASGAGNMLGVMISRPFRDLTPGQTYVAQLNYTTNIPAAQMANFSKRMYLQLQIQAAPDNTFFTSSRMAEFSAAQASTVVTNTVTVATDNVWQQMYVEFKLPENAFGIPDAPSVSGATTDPRNWLTNFYLNVRTFANQGCPAYNVYVDNVYLYEKCASDLNFFDANSDANNQGLAEDGVAYGATMLESLYFTPPGQGSSPMAMGFDAGTTLASNGWRNYFTDVSGSFAGLNLPAGTDPSLTMSIGTAGRLNSAGCLQLRIANGTPNQPTNTQGNSVGVDGGRVFSYGIDLSGKVDGGTQINDPSGQPLPDLSGASYYGLSFWVRSDAPDFRTNPHLKAYLQETRPGNQQQLATVLVGPAGMPRAGDGWIQYYCVGAFADWSAAGRKTMERVQIMFEPLADAKRRDLNYQSVAGTVMTKANQATPGYNANSNFYIDDVAVHKVDNNDVYFNVSLFQ
jgi:hypothetical protein